jgi:hypothetical protein
MTTSAWLMLAATWTVVLFVVSRFFIKILRTPLQEDDED